MMSENVYGELPTIHIGNLEFEIESYFIVDNEYYLQLCNPEIECDAKLNSLSDKNIKIITDAILKRYSKQINLQEARKWLFENRNKLSGCDTAGFVKIFTEYFETLKAKDYNLK